MIKRIISIVLCLCMVLGMVVWMPAKTAYAATQSQLNIVARANYMYSKCTWNCKQNVYGWCYNYMFYAGNTYHIPYGQPINSGYYVGYGVDIDTYLKAANTAGSVFYTARSSYGSTSSTFYANDCSAFVSWCWGIGRNTTATIPNYSTYLGQATAGNCGLLQIGDCLNSNSIGHVVLVTGLSNNNQTIEITEQTPPEIKRSIYTAAQLGNKYSAYGIYRYGGSVPAAPATEPENVFVTDGVYNISLQSNTAFALGTEGGKTNSGANIELENKTIGNQSQQFVFRRKAGTNYYTIRNLKSGMFLDNNSGSKDNGSNVAQYTGNGTDAQLWSLEDAGNGGYYLRNKAGNNVLDLSGGKVAAGTNIQVWAKDTNTPNQKWKLELIPTLADGVYTISSAADSKYRLEISGKNMDNGGNLNIWENNGDGDNQKFVVMHNEAGFYTLRALHSNRYIDVNGGNATNGTNVQQYDYNGSVAQLWSAVPNADGTISFASKSNSLYMDVKDGSIKNGSNIQTWEGNETVAQSWRVSPWKTINDGVYRLEAQNDRNMVFGIKDNGTDAGSVTALRAFGNGYEQKFAVEYVGDGYYSIRAPYANHYIDLSGGNMANDATIALYGNEEGGPNNNEQWRILPNADGSYSVCSKVSNKYIDLDAGKTAEGTKIHMWEGSAGGNTQKWWFVADTLAKDGVYEIKSNDGKYLNSSDTNEGSKVSLGTSAQPFVMTVLGNNQFYVIRNLNSQRNLNASKTNTDIYQWSQATTDVENNEQWSMIPHNDGTYSFVNRWNGEYLSHDGTTLKTAAGNRTDANQRWTIGTPAQTIKDGIYQILSNKDQTFALDVQKLSDQADDRDGANLQIYTKSNGEMQKFAVQYMGNGLYRLTCMNSFKCIDVDGASGKSAVNLQQWTPNDSAAQSFAIIPNADGSYTVLNARGMAVDIDGGTMENSRNVRTYWSNGTVAQQWIFNRTASAKLDLNGQFALISALNAGFTAEISGSNVQLGTKDGRSNEVFEFVANNDGTYCIVNGGKYISDNGTSNVLTSIKTDAEKWQIIPNADGSISLVNVATGKYFTVNGNAAAGTDIAPKADGTATAAHWNLEAYSHIHNYKDTVTKPTCTERGYTTHTCAECGDSYKDTYTVALGHAWNSGTITKQPTCTATGIKTFTCTACGTTKTETVAATGHKAITDPAKAATCTTTGLTEGSHCSVCNTVLVAQQTIPALGHAWDNGKNTAEPTCTKAGIKTYTCSRCQTTRTENIAALGHAWDNGTVSKQATCTVDGVKTYHCARCTEAKTEAIPATGHNAVTDLGRNATCTEAGLTEGSHCATCGATIAAQQPIAALGHDWNGGETIIDPICSGASSIKYTCNRCGETEIRAGGASGHSVVNDPAKNPTCTEGGLTAGSHCALCGAVITAPQPIPPLGHNWNSGYITLQPTCTETGLKTYNCTRCAEAKTETVAAKGHTIVTDPAKTATCTEDGKTAGSHCAVCTLVIVAQQTIPATGHNYAQINHVDPTEVEDGYTQFACLTCGNSYKEVIPAEGCPSAAYKDVKRSQWYHESVDFMVSNGYMYGMQETYFGLTENVTRGQFAAILYRIVGAPNVDELENPFTDVKKDDYYYNAIRWAYSTKVVSGTSDTTYSPKKAITREQFASILYRYMNNPEVEADNLAKFPDKAKVSAYAVPAVNWAVGTGLLRGNSINGIVYLQPKNNASRAQSASLFYRFVTNFVQR